MKKKMPDPTLPLTASAASAQRRMPIIEWIGEARVSEESPLYAASDKKEPTLSPSRRLIRAGGNAQRSTLNAQRQRETRFDLEERLLEFSARIIRLVDALPNSRAANHVAGQLLRCGTSPYGNHGEVEAAESRKDFIHKLRICLKELKETRRWLRLAAKAAMVPVPKMAAILPETEELIKIFFSSIRTAERNAK
jgi:four helix bundle protein